VSAARRRGFELPVVRVVVERAPGLGRERGRPLRTPEDAARVLAPFLEQAPPAQRLAMALLDARQRLLAVALLDGGEWRACCLRPSEVYEPALVAGAAGLYLAHRHPSKKLWAVRADCTSLDQVWRMGQALDLCVHDHLIFDARGCYASLRASQDAWAGWVFRRMTQRHPLPVYASCVRDAEAAVEAGPATGAVVAPAERVQRIRSGRSRGASFTLCGLHARLVHDEPRVSVDDRSRVLTHLDVAEELGLVLERRRGTLVAGLLDASRRLFAVALIGDDGGDRCACEAVAPEAVYRAALACGAHSVFVAHDHAQSGPRVGDADHDWTVRAYELGCELGLELRDHLLFAWDGDFDGGYQSLRQRHVGPKDWGVDDDPATTPYGLRLRQAMRNRRPEGPTLTRARSARAALKSCAACGRRSGVKAACPWCGAPRPRAGISAHDRAA
jgi:DNA repair protein RadC